MREQASTSDVKKREPLIDRLRAIVYEQVPIIYLVHPNTLVALSPKLGNAAPSVLRPRVLWNAEQLFLSDDGHIALRNKP